MPGGVQGLDRYAYVNNNPVRYNDPSGHKPKSNINSLAERIINHERHEVYYDYAADYARQNLLYSMLFPGPKSKSYIWTEADWKYYDNNRYKLWNNPPGNESFTEILYRFVSLPIYSNCDKDSFLRDFGLVFAGIPSSGSVGDAFNKSKFGPPITYLNIGNKNLPYIYRDSLSPNSNQSHHYTAFFLVGYFWSDNWGTFFNSKDTFNNGDLMLGNIAASQGQEFQTTSNFALIVSCVDSIWNSWYR